MLAGHSALGLAFAALIYIVCLTGTVSVFLMELQRWEQPDGPRPKHGALLPRDVLAQELGGGDAGAPGQVAKRREPTHRMTTEQLSSVRVLSGAPAERAGDHSPYEAEEEPVPFPAHCKLLIA